MGTPQRCDMAGGGDTPVMGQGAGDGDTPMMGHGQGMGDTPVMGHGDTPWAMTGTLQGWDMVSRRTLINPQWIMNSTGDLMIWGHSRGTAVVTPEPMGNTGESVVMVRCWGQCPECCDGDRCCLVPCLGGTGMSLSPALPRPYPSVSLSSHNSRHWCPQGGLRAWEGRGNGNGKLGAAVGREFRATTGQPEGQL